MVDASPTVVASLRSRFADTPNVHVVWSAIANETGTLPFYDNENSEASSLVEAQAEVKWKGKTTKKFEVRPHNPAKFEVRPHNPAKFEVRPQRALPPQTCSDSKHVGI